MRKNQYNLHIRLDEDERAALEKGLQALFPRGAFILVQPDVQVILILPHGTPFSARRRHVGVRVLGRSAPSLLFHGALRNILFSAGFPAMFHMITSK